MSGLSPSDEKRVYDNIPGRVHALLVVDGGEPVSILTEIDVLGYEAGKI
jgi:CBS domain-containing protein